MKSYMSAPVGIDVATQLQYEALNTLFSNLSSRLGPSPLGADATREGHTLLTSSVASERPNIVCTYWNTKYLSRVEPVLQQIAVLESKLGQDEQAGD